MFSDFAVAVVVFLNSLFTPCLCKISLELIDEVWKEKKSTNVQCFSSFVSVTETVEQQTTEESKSHETSEKGKEQAEEPMDEN